MDWAIVATHPAPGPNILKGQRILSFAARKTKMTDSLTCFLRGWSLLERCKRTASTSPAERGPGGHPSSRCGQRSHASDHPWKKIPVYNSIRTSAAYCSTSSGMASGHSAVTVWSTDAKMKLVDQVFPRKFNPMGLRLNGALCFPEARYERVPTSNCTMG